MTKSLSCFMALTMLVGFVVLTGSAVHAQPGLNFRIETAPVCGSQQLLSWQLTRDAALGVAGRDPVAIKGNTSDYLGEYAAFKDPKYVFGKNWYPVDGLKHTLCGKLHHYDFYDGFFSGGEADWNHFIIPNQGFGYLIDDVRPLMKNPLGTTGWHFCSPGQFNCMEAEITPDQSFYGNRWFPKPVIKVTFQGRRAVVNTVVKDDSPLEGRPLCTYGPWVYEEVHGNRPEIHPSELLWWRESRTDGGSGPEDWLLMLVQDDSNRFDRSGDFSGSNRPREWRPWSQFPRTGEFKIGFEVNLPEPPHTYTILELEKRHIVTGTLNTPEAREARRDADDGKQHALEYQGRVALKVNELQAEDDNIGVRFEDICRDDANSRLQGYITITSMVGRGDGRGDLFRPNPFAPPVVRNSSPANEGYHVIRVVRDLNLPPIEQQSTSTAQVVNFTALPLSLRRADVDGRLQLVGDYEIHMVAGQGESSANITITKAEFVIGDKRLTLVSEPSSQRTMPGESKSVIKGVPVFVAGDLDITTRSDTQRFTPPPASLVPYVEKQAPLSATADRSAWSTMMRAVNASPPPSASPGQLMMARQWQISVSPAYGGMRDGRASPVEESPFSEELNEIVRAGVRNLTLRVFDSAKPFKVEWAFKALNLSTGEEVPVKVVRVGSPARANEVRVELLPGFSFEGRAIRVTFPSQPSDAIYELTATATMSDTNGATGVIQQRVWSHFLPASPEALRLEESTLLGLATLAGIQTDNLQTALRLDDAPSAEARREVRTRRARMLRLLLRHTSEDSRITVEELRSLINVAKLFSTQ